MQCRVYTGMSTEPKKLHVSLESCRTCVSCSVTSIWVAQQNPCCCKSQESHRTCVSCSVTSMWVVWVAQQNPCSCILQKSHRTCVHMYIYIWLALQNLCSCIYHRKVTGLVCHDMIGLLLYSVRCR